MKDIILSIAEESGLKIAPLKEDHLELFFGSFKNKDDFYLFLFIDENKLQEEFKELKDLEFAINRIANNAKDHIPQEYKERALDNNFSFLIFIKSKAPIQEQYSKRIEENHFVAKKYVLEFEENDWINLKDKLEDKINITHHLCLLGSLYSETLNDKEQNSWYLLLLKLFIKLPFLNYNPVNGGTIPNLDEKITESLSGEDLEFLELIEQMESLSNSEFENILLEKNIISNI